MDTIQPGQMLGPYRIINQIGRGGMATVYKAYQPSVDRYVAVKVLPSQLAESREFAARFQQEAGEGTARELVGWRDREREEDCSFARVADGTWRCLPAVQWSETFSDAACTVPLGTRALADECATAMPYVGRTAVGACGGRLEALWEIGARTLPAAVYQRDGAGGCAEAAPDPGLAYFAVGAEAPLDGFVAAELAREDGPARLDDRVLIGEDGSRMPQQLYDGELDARCWMWLLADEDRWHCLPIGNGIAYWSDAACSAPVAAAEVACVLEEPYPYVSQTVTDACGYTIRIFERGPELLAPTLYAGDSASCAAVPVPDDEVWWAVGAEIGRDAFVAADKVAGDESGRLRGNYLATDDGFRRRAGGYVDTVRGEECIPARLTDGTVRCLPVNFGNVVTYYADAACTTVLPVVEQTFPVCRPAPAASIAIEYVVAGCDTQLRARAVGAELPSGTFFRAGGTGCEVYIFDPGAVRYYALGAELPATDFVELVDVTE